MVPEPCRVLAHRRRARHALDGRPVAGRECLTRRLRAERARKGSPVRRAVSLERGGRVRRRKAKGAKGGGVDAGCGKAVRSRTRLSRGAKILAASAGRNTGIRIVGNRGQHTLRWPWNGRSRCSTIPMVGGSLSAQRSGWPRKADDRVERSVNGEKDRKRMGPRGQGRRGGEKARERTHGTAGSMPGSNGRSIEGGKGKGGERGRGRRGREKGKNGAGEGRKGTHSYRAAGRGSTNDDARWGGAKPEEGGLDGKPQTAAF